MFASLNEIVVKCQKEDKEFWQVILEDDIAERNVTENESFEKMGEMWDAMYHAALNYDGDIKSASSLSGGDGKKMEEFIRSHECLCGEFVGKVITQALKMGESNACMKRIVAAPTAGACGVMPALLVPYYEKLKNDTSDEAARNSIIKSLYIAAGIGQVIASRASISGAQGGCQAEIGSASAMAAGSLTYLLGGNEKQIAHSLAMALKNLLGLVCDPVAGLVEVPCVKRNVIGAVNALSSSQMALAGIESKIPPDEVIDAMAYVGDKMDISLKETGIGGLAGTDTAKKITL